MMLEYFEDLKSGLQAKIDEAPDSTNARKRFGLEVAKLGTRLYSGGGKIAWCGVTAPFDLLNAMGVTSCFVEFVGAMLAATGTADGFITKAEQAGHSSDSCAYHRSVIGALLQGVMPEPDFIIGTSSPCIAGLGVMENMAARFKKDLFVLNIPQEKSKESVGYLADQIKDMAKFISNHTGRPLDEDRLEESIEYTNQARELMIEVYKLARQVPSPINGRILRDFGVVAALFLGKEAAVDLCRAFRDEFQAVIESGSSGVPGEKLRLMWIQNRIQFRYPIEKMLEDEFKANIVIDELNDITWEPIDPKKPYTDMARRIISIPFSTNIERRIKHLQKLSKDYQIDGAINPCHRGCRQGTGVRGLIGRGLNEIDVPVLNLEIDCVDSRSFAEGQVKTRVEAFMEMLENRTSPWN
jgi:benzoyl-CoA reductase/2-hydroxyglutaryl-CoA dehydratase subunit BcrC/BadD/HgdB